MCWLKGGKKQPTRKTRFMKSGSYHHAGDLDILTINAFMADTIIYVSLLQLE